MNKVLLGDVAEEVRENYKETDGNPAVVGLEHLIPGEIRLKEWSEDTNTTFTKAFHKDQVLFGRRRAYLKKAAVASVDGICSGDITVISAKQDKILPELLPFVIQNDDFFDFAVGKSAGSLSPRVKWSKLKEYEFNLPSLPQQRKLAKLLWSFVDAKEAYEDLICQMDELVKSQFIEMFGDPKNAAAKPGMVKGEMLFSLASGKANTIENLNDQYPYECYGGNGITGNSKNYLVKDPTIVIGRVGEYCGSVHMTSPFSWITDNAIYITDYDEKTINLEFLYRECQVMDFHRFAATVGQPKITQKPLLESFYIVPTMERQNQYVDIAEQSDKSKFELQYVKRNVKEMIKCSQKKIQLNR